MFGWRSSFGNVHLGTFVFFRSGAATWDLELSLSTGIWAWGNGAFEATETGWWGFGETWGASHENLGDPLWKPAL